MRRLTVAVLACMIGTTIAMPSAKAANESPTEQANKGTVAIMTGEFGGSDVRIAADLAAVLDEGDILRVLPVLGQGSLRNINDLLYLRGVDLAIVQADAMSFARDQGSYPNLEQRLSYVTKLYSEELHIVAGNDVNDLYDLQSKRVNFVSEVSGSYVTGQILLQSLGITVEPVFLDTDLAIESIKSGEIDATVLVTGKPSAQIAEIGRNDGLKLLPVSGQVTPGYQTARLLPEDYPSLIDAGTSIETLSIDTALVAYNFKQDHWRYAKVARFVDAFLGRFDEFLEAPRDPKWREVDIAQPFEGWQRFGPVENWLRDNVYTPPSPSVSTPVASVPAAATPAAADPAATASTSVTGATQTSAVSRDPSLRRAFREFLADQSTLLGADALSQLNRDELFDRFIQWQRQRSIQSRSEPNSPTF